jgi:hypothetical protein
MTAPSIQQFRLVRSASLNGYIELVKSLGYDPARSCGAWGCRPGCSRIPRH